MKADKVRLTSAALVFSGGFPGDATNKRRKQKLSAALMAAL
jgi:hypothetical protein